MKDVERNSRKEYEEVLARAYRSLVRLTRDYSTRFRYLKGSEDVLATAVAKIKEEWYWHYTETMKIEELGL